MKSSSFLKLPAKPAHFYTAYSICFLLILSIAETLWAGQIIRPWRSTTAIVKQGETFDIWYDADVGETISYVKLKSDFITIDAGDGLTYSEDKGSNDQWQYDLHSDGRYDNIITVTVPPLTPADRYELLLGTSSGEVSSTGAVKVVQEWRNEYYVVGTGCAHRYTGEDINNDGRTRDDSTEDHDNDSIALLRKISEILKIADIMDVQLFFEAGDNIGHPNGAAAYYHGGKYPGRPTRDRMYEYLYGIEELGIKGPHSIMAASFITAGNHEAADGTANGETPYELATYYNQYFGMYYHGTAYGNARYICVNNGWGGGQYNPTGQMQIVRDTWLNTVSPGNLVVGIMHKKQDAATSVYEAQPFGLSLVAHNHTYGSNNPLSIPLSGGGFSPPMQYVADSQKVLSRFEFNLFKVNNSNGTYTTPSGVDSRTQVIQGDVQSQMSNHNAWIRNLELNYNNSNNGSSTSTTATITNRFNFDVDEAKIRFVMPKGNTYAIISGNGFIRQAFDGDNYHVVDVAIDAPAFQDTVVTLGIPQGNIASFVDQTVPSELSPGETAQVSITMKNRGLEAWSSSEGHTLGSQNPENNSTWGLNRVSLTQSVAPNADYTFTFNITAPSAAGVYEFSWRMIDESGANQGWFGATTPSVFIPVGQFYDTTEEAGIFSHDAVNPPLGEEPENSIDNDINTKYLTFNTTTFLQYQYSSGLQKVCKGFSFTSAADASHRDPISAVFKGSNDGSNWDLLASRAGLVFLNRGDRQFFGFSNDTAYAYYRLELITDDPGEKLQVGEIEFLAIGTGPTNPPGPQADPIRIEAEDYDAMFGIATQNTGDTGGGLNVKDISIGDWMDYNINLPTSGTYEVRFRVASLSRGSAFYLKEGSTVLASFDEPATGDWQVYTTVSSYVTLSAGNTTLRIEAFDSHWNFNWFELVPPAEAPIDPDLDPDNDGVPNILEIALGGDPNTADSESILPQATESTNSIDLIFNRADASTVYVIQKSTDLVNWENYLTVDDSHALVGENCVIPVANSQMSSGKLFLRLQVSR